MLWGCATHWRSCLSSYGQLTLTYDALCRQARVGPVPPRHGMSSLADSTHHSTSRPRPRPRPLHACTCKYACNQSVISLCFESAVCGRIHCCLPDTVPGTSCPFPYVVHPFLDFYYCPPRSLYPVYRLVYATSFVPFSPVPSRSCIRPWTRVRHGNHSRQDTRCHGECLLTRRLESTRRG